MAERSPESSEGQRIVRVPGSRRARLTPVPGTDPNPEPLSRDAEPPAAASPRPATTKAPDRGPNDERLRLDVPPHY